MPARALPRSGETAAFGWRAVPRPVGVALLIAVVLVIVDALGPLAVPPASGPLPPLVLLLLAGVVAARVCCRPANRVGWSFASAALAAWAARAAMLETDGALPAAAPAVAAEWAGVAFYALAALSVIALVWSRIRRIEPTLVFDGLIVALTVGATVAFAVFEILLEGTELEDLATGTVAAVGDVGVLFLVVLGVVLFGANRDRSTSTCAVGLVLLLTGDFAHEVAHGLGRHVHGFSLLSILGAVVFAAAAWVPADRRQPRGGSRSVAIVSFGATAVALALLSVDAFTDEGEIGLLLALAALAMALPRLFLAGRTAQQLAVAEHEMRIDELTGLGNRRRFFDELGSRLSAGRPVTVAVADLRGFKYVNDSYGHHVGDEVLRQVGLLWSAMLGPGDVLVRLGGDEFGLILDDDGREGGDAVPVAIERIRALHRALDTPLRLGTLHLQVGASLGVASGRGSGLRPDELVNNADLAMYHAKRGDAGVEVYDAEVVYEGRDRLRRIADLQRALAADELVLFFQPVVHAGSGAVTGAEALLRWRHPEQGLLAPVAFLPLVAEAGLIESVTRVVVHQAVAELARWRAAGLELCLAINVTAADLLGDQLVDTLHDALRHHDVDPRRLIVEITEESFVADLPRASRTVDRLRDAGMSVAVDDFGVGFSSLSQLQHLVVDELKLDRSLTSAFTSNPRAAAVVRSAVLLAHGLDMTVVAEGVEDPETWRALASAGCDLIQGYLVARPMPAEQFAIWLATARTGVEGVGSTHDARR